MNFSIILTYTPVHLRLPRFPLISRFPTKALYALLSLIWPTNRSALVPSHWHVAPPHCNSARWPLTLFGTSALTARPRTTMVMIELVNDTGRRRILSQFLFGTSEQGALTAGSYFCPRIIFSQTLKIIGPLSPLLRKVHTNVTHYCITLTCRVSLSNKNNEYRTENWSLPS